MEHPEGFHKAHQQLTRDTIEYLRDLRETIKWSKNEKVLDVGCGPGNSTVKILLPFLPEDATLVACDISEKMIDYASSNFNHPRVTFRVMDIESNKVPLLWEKESFTKIFTCFLIYNKVTGIPQAFGNMYFLLKPGGEVHHMYFGDYAAITLLDEMRDAGPWKNYIKGKTYFWMYTEKSFEERKALCYEEMKRAGFKEIEMKVEECEYFYPCAQGFIDILKSVDPYHKYVPDAMKNDYNAIFQEKCRNVLLIDEGSGRATAKYSLIIVRARKL